MTSCTQGISDRARWAWNNPGRAIIRSGQLALSIACTDIAYHNLMALYESGAVPCSVVCSYPQALEAAIKIGTAAGMVLAAYTIAKKDFFRPALPPQPIPKRIEAEVQKFAEALS